MKTVFLAHAKDVADEQLEVWRAQVERLAKKGPVKVVLGREDYERWFDRAGRDWGGWTRMVAERYEIIVVPHGLVGSGTARIVEEALRRGKLIFVLAEDGASLRPVKGIEKVFADNQKGWALT